MPQRRRFHLYPDAEDLEAHAADALLRAAAQAISARGRFRIVLAGGNTPRALYARLSRAQSAWAHWHVYFGDERCLPKGDHERNDVMAADAWLDHVPIPRPQIHPIPAEQAPDAAARHYAETLAGVDRFDVVLLGLGEDGHTASLFPGREPDAGADVLAVAQAPKPPPNRVTLGPARLSRSRQVLFLVVGTAKRPAVVAWRGAGDIPAAAIVPAGGVDVLIDADAWPEASS